MLALPLVMTSSLALAQPAAPRAAPTEPPPVHAAPPAEARRLSDAFVAVADRVSPSVVQVEVTSRDERQELMQRLMPGDHPDAPVQRGMGSGVVLSADGEILTNNHVIDEALTVHVRFKDGKYLPARLVGRDPSTDLALLKVDAQNLQPARLADSDAARVGEWVVAIGSPFGLGYTVTTGVLSAKGRGGIGMNAIEDYLQTDAGINPGNSGGPLCDLNGGVVGINTMVVGRGNGIGFAVPSNLARRVAAQIRKTGRVQRAWIGVGVQDLTPDLATAMKVDSRAGALVNSVNDAGPAFKANVRPGDVIGSLGGKPVRDAHELIREVLNHDVGETVSLEILRAGTRYGASVQLAARPEPAPPPIPAQQIAPARPGLGLAVQEIHPEHAARLGLAGKPLAVITRVDQASPADRAGLKPYDVVVECDGVAYPTPAQVAEAGKDGQLVLRLRRANNFFYAAVRR